MDPTLGESKLTHARPQKTHAFCFAEEPVTTSRMFAARRGGRTLLAEAASPSAAAVVTLPGFLVPAFQARPFSASTTRPSKLGRTPISIPPGVELTIGDLAVKKDMTTYLRIPKRTVSVEGPLGKAQWVCRWCCV